MSERGSKTSYGGKEQILRTHISSMSRLPTDEGKLAYSCFENKHGKGPIRIVDLQRRAIIFDGQEHLGRSWEVTFPSPNILASGADDGLIKLWDTRLAAKSQCTLPKLNGRISCLVSPKENLVLSGHCHDRPRTSQDKGCITLWDLRMPLAPASSEWPALQGET